MSFGYIEVFLILLMRRWGWDDLGLRDLGVSGLRNAAFLLTHRKLAVFPRSELCVRSSCRPGSVLFVFLHSYRCDWINIDHELEPLCACLVLTHPYPSSSAAFNRRTTSRPDNTHLSQLSPMRTHLPTSGIVYMYNGVLTGVLHTGTL